MTFEYLGVAACSRCRVYRGSWLASGRRRPLCSLCMTAWARRGLAADECWIPRRSMRPLDDDEAESGRPEGHERQRMLLIGQ